MGARRLTTFDAAVYLLMTALGLWLFSAADLRSQIIGTLAALVLAHGTRATRLLNDESPKLR